MEKENQRVAISKRLLKEGLLRLLEHKDLDRISVIELCRESSINRATFYRHYQTPKDVMLDIEREYVEQMQKTFMQKSLLPPKTLEDIKNLTYELCFYLYNHADLVKILLRCHTGDEIVRDFSDNIWKIDIRSTLDEDTWQLVTAFLGFGSYQLVRKWLTEDIQKTPQEVAELIYAILDLGKVISIQE